MDPLEKFITDNREDFDNQNPDPIVWENISLILKNNKCQKPPKDWVNFSIKIAAAIILAMISTFLYNNNYNSNNITISTDELIVQVQPDFFEVRKYFDNQVQQKLAQLKTTLDTEEIEKDLNEIDKASSELLSELNQTPGSKSPMLIQKLINNYKTKIDILEYILEKINEDYPNNSKSNNDVKI